MTPVSRSPLRRLGLCGPKSCLKVTVQVPPDAAYPNCGIGGLPSKVMTKAWRESIDC